MTAETAAALLGTSTTILGLWEKRFGYPERVRSADGQWLYADEAMIALRCPESRAVDRLGHHQGAPAALGERRRRPAGNAAPGLRGGKTKLQAKLSVIAGITALGAVPAVALGAAGGHPNRPTTHDRDEQAAQAAGRRLAGRAARPPTARSR